MSFVKYERIMTYLNFILGSCDDTVDGKVPKAYKHFFEDFIKKVISARNDKHFDVKSNDKLIDDLTFVKEHMEKHKVVVEWVDDVECVIELLKNWLD